MTIDEAKTAVTLGVPFGSLYPMLNEIDRDDFRNWYVREKGVPNLRDRPHRKDKVLVPVGGCGYTGNPCPSCGGVRMVRRGKCETCEDCSDSTSCS